MSKYIFLGLKIVLVLGIIGFVVLMFGSITWMHPLSDTKVNYAQVNISSIHNALDVYRLDMGEYPENLESLTQNINNHKMWHGPYLKRYNKPLLDPWGNPYQYRRLGKNFDAFELYSFGSDGKQGGSGYDADIFEK